MSKKETGCELEEELQEGVGYELEEGLQEGMGYELEEELQEGMGYDLEEELQENRTFLSKSSCETVESPTKHLRKLTVINVIGALNQFNNRYEI